MKYIISLWIIIGLVLYILDLKKQKEYKILLKYYDNSEELLIYNELPNIIADSSTFCVIDSESKICGVKSFKITK